MNKHLFLPLNGKQTEKTLSFSRFAHPTEGGWGHKGQFLGIGKTSCTPENQSKNTHIQGIATNEWCNKQLKISYKTPRIYETIHNDE